MRYKNHDVGIHNFKNISIYLLSTISENYDLPTYIIMASLFTPVAIEYKI